MGTMTKYEFNMQRLFFREALTSGAELEVNRAQANYLLSVLRLKNGDKVLVFNGRDGEWLAAIRATGRKACILTLVEQLRVQTSSADLLYLFAPLKHARLDYMVQKAVEMGADRLRPVVTRHTQSSRINLERMEANVIEAAEQCGVISVPSVLGPVKLGELLEAWPQTEPGRRLIFCDESEESQNPLEILGDLKNLGRIPLAVIIGPEGGFSPEERKAMKALPFVTPIPLGPRILRADTAAVAALTLIQATLGDWA